METSRVPQVFAGRFGANTPRNAWTWEDSPSDDAGLAAALAAVSASGYEEKQDWAVDRGGATPTLIWQAYTRPNASSPWTPTGSWGALPLFVGMLISLHGSSHGTDLGDAYWESDQYGRPFDLNDLLA